MMISSTRGHSIRLASKTPTTRSDEKVETAIRPAFFLLFAPSLSSYHPCLELGAASIKTRDCPREAEPKTKHVSGAQDGTPSLGATRISDLTA